MPGVQQVSLKIFDSHEQEVGILSIRCLPNSRYQHDFPLWDLREEPYRDPTTEPVQILESEEYRYQIITRTNSRISTDKPELFAPDDEEGRNGRLRPKLYTGALPIRIFAGEEVLGRVQIEVRSRKLDYLSHYRWMLRDIASTISEIVIERFAPTQQKFTPDAFREPSALYQQFAFLRSLITGSDFEAALAQILDRPHTAWVNKEEMRSPSMGLQGGSAILRTIVGSGRRQQWSHPQISALTSIPVEVSTQRRIESIDTSENRFVKFALTYWRNIISEIRQHLLSAQKSYPVERGLRETNEVLAVLDAALNEELFREVGNLTVFPASSPVLSRREGYREIFHAYLQSEVAAQLTWQGGEEVYGVGQRNVATLYEFWTFLEIAKVLTQLCDQEPIQLSELLSVTSDGLGLRLKRGTQLVLSGSISRLGRKIDIELYFNRSFTSRVSSPIDGSWTRPMQPDCSLRISLNPSLGINDDVIWLHFDAKYKVENVAGLFGTQPVTDDEEKRYIDDELETWEEGKYKRADLLKMHAYRDAVRRSTGAYILYPGTEKEILRRYQEILPGIGAFPLKPSDSGLAEGTSAIAAFLEDVLTHFALQSTQHERGRYWNKIIFELVEAASIKLPALSFLSKPPADTRVLLALMNSREHYDWIIRSKLFILLRDDNEGILSISTSNLAIDFILLFGELVMPEFWSIQGETKLLTRTELATKGYPNTISDVCLALPLGEGPFTLPLPNISLTYLQRLQQQATPTRNTQTYVVMMLLELMGAI